MLKNKKIKKVIIVAIILVFAITIIALAANYFTKTAEVMTTPTASVNSLDDDSQSKDGSLPSQSEEDIRNELQNRQITVTDTISPCIVFSTGKNGDVGKWQVENIESNSYIQQVEVFVDNNLIAKTTPIYPGQYIDSINLNQDIPGGDLKAIAYINYYNVDTKEYVGKTAYDITITVG